MVNEVAQRAKVKPFEVWPENWTSVEMFLRMTTQWTLGAMGGFVGLNYGSLEFLFRVFKIEDERGTLEAIQTMEFAALEVLNEKRD